MNNCSNLYFLSTIACKLSECLSDDGLAVLSADLMTLGDMLASILARRAMCKNEDSDDSPVKFDSPSQT